MILSQKLLLKRFLLTSTFLICLSSTLEASFREAELPSRRESTRPYGVCLGQRREPGLFEMQAAFKKNLLTSIQAREDQLTPLLQTLRPLLKGLPPESQKIINDRFEGLLDDTRSLLPHTFLQSTHLVSTIPQLGPNDFIFKHFNKMMESLKVLSEDPALKEVASLLTRLQAYYLEYRDMFCRVLPHERLFFLSALPLKADCLEHPVVLSQEMTYTILSTDKYGITTKQNKDGSSPNVKIGPIYFKTAVFRKCPSEPRKLVEEDTISSPSFPYRLFKKLPQQEQQEQTVKKRTLLDPGMEWAMWAFHTALFGEGIAPSAFLVFPQVPHYQPALGDLGKEARKLIEEINSPSMSADERDEACRRLYQDESLKKQLIDATAPFAAQASYGIEGILLETFLQQAQENPRLFETLDKGQVQKLLISLLLTNPNDAKGNNFIVTNGKKNRKIISIDNDLSFAARIIAGGKGKIHLPEVRNLLFMIPEFMDRSLLPDVSDHFLKQEPTLLLLQWLRALDKQNARYQTLESDLGTETFTLFRLPFQFQHGTLKRLHQEITKLQQVLHIDRETPLQKLLESLSPLLGIYYQKLRDNAKDKNYLAMFDRLYGGHQQTQFEKLFNLEEQKLPDGRMVREALEEEQAQENEFKHRTQPIKEALAELLETFDPVSLESSALKAVLEELRLSFPEALKAVLLKTPLSNFLSASPSEELLDTFFTLFPERLHEIEKGTLFNPLHYALEKDHTELVAYLLDKGASPNQCTKDNHFPLDLAVQKKSIGSFTRLVSCGAQEILDIPAVESFYDTHKENTVLKEDFQTLFTKNPCFQGIVLRNHFFTPTAPRPDATPIYLSGYEKPFYLSEALEDQLFDKSSGKFKAINTDGRREIGLLEEGEYSLFFKKYPAFSGIEQGVRHLAYRLFQSNMGYSALAKINDEPYLLTLGLGKDPKVKTSLAPLERLNPYKEANLSYILKHKPDRLQEIDAQSLSQAILMAMLVNQEDGKPNNFALYFIPQSGKFWLVSFDNDQSFVPEIMQSQGKNKTCPQVKSVLFCLEAMEKSFHTEVVKRLLQVNIDDLFKEWLEEMQGIHEADQALFTPQQRETFWHKKESFFGESKECYIGVPMLRREEGRTEGIGYLYGTLALMQRCFNDNKAIHGSALLKAVHPFVAHRYQQGLRECSQKSIGERFKHIDGKSYRGEVTLTTSGRMVEAWGIPSHEFIKEAEKEEKVVMPKTALEDLKALQEKRKTIELDILTRRGKNNAAIRALLHHKGSDKAVESIDIDLRGYTNCQEEWLLQALTKQYKIQALSLRASSITNSFWQFAERPLTEVQFFECQNLTNGIFLLLADQCPLLGKLSVTAAPRVTAVEKDSSFFVAAEPLIFKHLNSLNLSKNKQLERLQVNAPQLAHLFLSGCIKLNTVDLTESNTLKILDISNNPYFTEDQLQELCRRHTTLTRIKAQGCNDIFYPEILESSDNSSLKLRTSLKSRDSLIEAYRKSSDLKIPVNQLDIGLLHISQQQDLLDTLRNRNLQNMILVNCKALNADALQTLSFSHILHLDLRRCSGLSSFSKYTILTRKKLHAPFLKTLNLEGCTALKDIHLKAPLLLTLDAAHCPLLDTLRIEAPKLKRADFYEDKMLRDSELKKFLSQMPSLESWRKPKLKYWRKPIRNTRIKLPNIHDLPNEMLPHILPYISFKDFQQVSLVCKRWNEISKDPTLERQYVCKVMIVGYCGNERHRLIADLTGDVSRLKKIDTCWQVIGVNFHLINFKKGNHSFNIQLWEIDESCYYYARSTKIFFKAADAVIFDYSWREFSQKFKILSGYYKTLINIESLPPHQLLLNTEVFDSYALRPVTLNPEIKENAIQNLLDTFKGFEYLEYSGNTDDVLNWIIKNAFMVRPEPL